MKAYVAYSYDYDADFDVIGVFETLEEAKAPKVAAARIEEWNGKDVNMVWARHREKWIVTWPEGDHKWPPQ